MCGTLIYLSYLRDLGFGGAKMCGGCLKVTRFGMAMQATSGGGDYFTGAGGQGSHYVMLH